MPYQLLRNLSDEDLASIIVYIRSLQPVHSELPKGNIPFPLSLLINAVPEPVEQPVTDKFSDPLSRGWYLTRIASCIDCHTPKNGQHQPLPGMEFAGRAKIDEFPVASANITPDASGISYYDEAMFITVMRTGQVGARGLSVPMPWWNFRKMTDEDLKAIFAYLRTVKPVYHRVDNTESDSACKLCKGKHGAGAENGAP